MADAVYAQRAAAGTPRGALVPMQPLGTLPPLFFVHSADRNVMGYVNLVRHLGADQPAWGLRDQGDTARPLATIAAEHVRTIRSVQPRGPYYLVGWCFGGHVASEMAQQLERAGETVAFLGLLDTMSPVIAQQWPRSTDAQLAVAMARDVAMRWQRPLEISGRALEELEWDEIVRRVVATVRAQGAAPADYDEDVLREQCAMIRDRGTSLEGYAPGPFRCPVTLFRATHDREPWDAFFASYTPLEQDTLGWCRHVSTPVEVFPVPGNHASLGSEPHVRVLAGHLRDALARARERVGFTLPDPAAEARP
ncbi:MAG TPA: thioesterase domain-containing protein [Longimicrobium sp.]|nr:thioesterase domain-containing protein [Longimicrobium sp.]